MMAAKDTQDNNDATVQRLLKQFYIQKETRPAYEETVIYRPIDTYTYISTGSTVIRYWFFEIMKNTSDRVRPVYKIRCGYESSSPDFFNSMIAEDAVRHISKEEASSIISGAAQRFADPDNLDMLE